MNKFVLEVRIVWYTCLLFNNFLTVFIEIIISGRFVGMSIL